MKVSLVNKIGTNATSHKRPHLPDEIFSLIFEEVQATRKPGCSRPQDQINLKRRKLAPVFVRLCCVNSRFRKLALPFLYSELTVTEMHDPRLPACFQECGGDFWPAYLSEPAAFVKSTTVLWELEAGLESPSLARALSIEVSKLRGRIYQSCAILHHFYNLTHLKIVLRSDNPEYEGDRQLAPSISEFSALPFLESLRCLELDDGRDHWETEVDSGTAMSKEDCDSLGLFVQRLPNLETLSLVGYDFDDMNFGVAEGADPKTVWPKLRDVSLKEFHHTSTESSTDAFSLLCRAGSSTLRKLSLTTPYASCKFAQAIEKNKLSCLETLCLRECGTLAEDVTDHPEEDYDWSNFVLAIPNCRHMSIDFSYPHTQRSWENFVFHLTESPTIWSTLKSLSLKNLANSTRIDPMACLDSFAILLSREGQALQHLNLTLYDLEAPSSEEYADRLANADPPHQTFSHMLLYKSLVVLELAYSKSVNCKVEMQSDIAIPWFYNTIVLDVAEKQIIIASDKPKHNQQLSDLLLTPPIRAIIRTIAGRGVEVIWRL